MCRPLSPVQSFADLCSICYPLVTFSSEIFLRLPPCHWLLTSSAPFFPLSLAPHPFPFFVAVFCLYFPSFKSRFCFKPIARSLLAPSGCFLSTLPPQLTVFQIHFSWLWILVGSLLSSHFCTTTLTSQFTVHKSPCDTPQKLHPLVTLARSHTLFGCLCYPLAL